MQARLILLFALVAPFFASLARGDDRAIGALSELSGNFARLGEDCRKGYEIGRMQNPSAARVIYGDNQSDPKAAISEYHRMVEIRSDMCSVSTIR